MIRLFRGTGIGPVLVMALIAGALWIQYFISPPQLTPAPGGDAMPLWDLIFGPLYRFPFLSVFLSFAMMAITIFVMIRFNTTVFFIPKRTYFPALFFILYFSAFPGVMILNPAMPAALLIMVGIWRMMAAYRMNGMAFNFFDAALIISCAGMFYAGALWFVLLVLAGALILRTPDFREITVTVAGALLPWIILYTVWYLTGSSLSDLTEIIRHNLFDRMPSVTLSRAMIVLLIVIAAGFIPALFSLVREMPTLKIKSRKTFELLLWMTVICAVVYALTPAVSVEIIAITAIPVSFVMSNYCTFTRRRVIAEVILWLIVVMIVVARLWLN